MKRNFTKFVERDRSDWMGNWGFHNTRIRVGLINKYDEKFW